MDADHTDLAFCDYCGADLPSLFYMRDTGRRDDELPVVKMWCGACAADPAEPVVTEWPIPSG